jgi:iron complex outermembrane receptor protein
MDVPVHSVSRHTEKLSETPSAVRVITGEEIRRSGATTLPQALRLASNLHVAQASAGYWAIGARGFNATATTSNKLLTLVDGRSVYTPLFSGTYWDSLDTFLPDVARIEVISGPGGSAWGANAVNGVISVISKSSAETQGGLLYAGAGQEEQLVGGFRYGGRLGARGHFRIYAKHLDFDGTIRPNGTDSRNRWVFSQTGFRSDLQPGGGSTLTVQGDLYTGWVEQTTSARGEYDGGNLLVRWVIPVGESTVTAKTYYDSARRGAPTTFGDHLDTLDFDLQQEMPFGQRHHRLVWGAGHRASSDRVRNLATQAFIPADFTHRLWTAFVHTEFELLPRSLRLTVGTKYEHNNYTGSDHQPNVRLAWLLAQHQTLWVAASRAVRTPSRVDRDLYIPPQPPFTAAGGRNFQSEILWAYEAGWRGRIGAATTASVVGYFHDYHGLRTLELPVPLQFANGLDARTYGAEVFVRHDVTTRVWLTAGYTLLKRDFRLKPWSRDLNMGLIEEADPENQFHVRASADVARHWELDLGLRHISRVPTVAARVQSNVPPYAELDARLAWLPRDDYEIALIGTNLLDRAHPETGAGASRREIERSVQARVIWRF